MREADCAHDLDFGAAGQIVANRHGWFCRRLAGGRDGLRGIRAVADRANAQPGTELPWTRLVRPNSSGRRGPCLDRSGRWKRSAWCWRPRRSRVPLGILLAFFLFRTDVWGGRSCWDSWLWGLCPDPAARDGLARCLRQRRPVPSFGVRPILVGRFGPAVVHAMAALPWVILVVGVGLAPIEPELEESALLDFGPWRVLTSSHITPISGGGGGGGAGGGRAHGRRHDRHRLAPGAHLCRGGYTSSIRWVAGRAKPLLSPFPPALVGHLDPSRRPGSLAG